MKYIYEPRASTIIYNLLIARVDSRPWLMPANICPIVPIIFLKAHVPFEFVDISALTFHMDLEQVEERIKTRKYGGLLYAHTYGELSTPQEFFVLAKNIAPELFVLDDRCLCVPDFESDEVVDLTLYSTGYAKIIDLGFGGYALAKDNFEYRSAKLPFDPQDHAELESSYKEAIQTQKAFIYHDSNWLETSAPVPAWYDYREKIESGLKTSLDHRDELNALYKKLLPYEIQLPQAYQTWRFNIRVRNKGSVLRAIFNAGLFASSHYASLAGIMTEGRAPRAELLANEVVNLFNDQNFDLQNAEKICKVILENYEG
jgi:hypothetical protein